MQIILISNLFRCVTTLTFNLSAISHAPPALDLSRPLTAPQRVASSRKSSRNKQRGDYVQIEFAPSRQSTLGVEWELALVNARTGELVSVANDVLKGVSANHPDLNEDDEHPHIKRELLLNTVELVTGICETVKEAKEDLSRSLAAVREVTDPMGVEVFCAGSHPFSPPLLQPVTDKERYAKLIERTQWWGRQMVIYGVHVHVGIDRRDKVLPILDGLVNYFPHFQALSASSPFWAGEETGYASQRALMFQQLPTAGLPFQFETWEAYESYVQDMFTTGVIDAISEIRWDIRPVSNLGTIEMRICDGLATLEEVGAIAALTQCLVDEFSSILDAGGSIPTMPPWHVQENKWRAAAAHVLRDHRISVTNPAQGLIGKHHTKPKRVTGSIALPQRDLMRRIQLLHQSREIQPARAASNNSDLHAHAPSQAWAARPRGPGCI